MHGKIKIKWEIVITIIISIISLYVSWQMYNIAKLQTTIAKNSFLPNDEFRQIFAHKSMPRLYLFIDHYKENELSPIAGFAKSLERDLNGYVSLRELEDSCKVNLRFMYLMDHEVPSYRTFGYFINEILSDSIEKLFYDINQKIFEKEHTDLQHLYIDGSKFEANANKYSWVWKKATEKSRYRLFEKITSLFQEINLELQYTGIKFSINTEYSPEYLKEAASKYVEIWQLDETTFVAGKGHRKSVQQRHYEKLKL